MTATIANEAQFYFGPMAGMIPFIEAGSVKDELNRVQAEVASGRRQGTAVSFGDLLDKLIVVHVPNLSPSAQQTFRNYAKYLGPLRDEPLRRLEEHPEIVEQFYARGIPGLRGNGAFLSAKSLRHVHWVLSQAFHAAGVAPPRRRNRTWCTTDGWSHG